MEQLTEQQRQEIKRKRREALAKRQQILAGRGKQGNGQDALAASVAARPSNAVSSAALPSASAQPQLTASSGRAVAPGGPADTRWRPPPPHHAAESGSGRSSGASGATGHESRAQGHLTHPAGGPSNTAPPRSDPGPGSGHSSGRPHPPLTRATPPAPALATDGIRGSAPAPPARLSGSGSGAARAQAGAVPGQPAPLPLAPVFTRNAGGPAGPSGLGPLVTVELMLAAGGRLGAKFGFHAAVQSRCRDLGGQWDAASRMWTWPSVSDAARVAEGLRATAGAQVQVKELHDLPMLVFRSVQTWPDDSERFSNIPERLAKRLLPFQREGIQFILKRGGRALLADDMGLGKTVQAIAAMAAYRDEWPALITCPTSTREAWREAMYDWLGVDDRDVFTVTAGKDSDRLSSSRPKVVIVTYTLLDKLRQCLGSMGFNVAIMDECHCIKAHTSKTTRAALAILKACKMKRVLMISGTPALNKPIEMFTAVSSLVPGVGLQAYGERYCSGGRFGEFQGASNKQELNAMLTNTIMIRRRKEDVLSQLPSKVRVDVWLEVPPADLQLLEPVISRRRRVAEMIHDLEGRRGAEASAELEGLRVEAKTLMNKLWSETVEVKRKPVQRHLEKMIDEGTKFLVFAHHLPMLDACQAVCRQKGVPHVRIDGSTPAADRQAQVQRFQENDSVRVAVLGITAANAGITLTAASTVVFAEMCWTPGLLQQCEDRAHRISQTSQVRVIYLLTAGTCDEHMRRTVVSKLCNIGTVLDGKAGKLASQTAPPAAQAGPDIGSYFARQAASQAATLGPGEAAGAGAGGAASGIDDADLVELVGWAEARGAMGGSGAGAGSGAAMSGLMREEGARAPPPVGQSSGPGPGSGSSPGPLQRACANAGPRGQGGVLPGNGPPAKRARTGGRVVAVD